MIKPLTSLRFFFAFLVFMSHCNLFLNEKGTFAHHLFFEGFAGVTFFFILSGFILAYTYQNRIIAGEITPKKFYINRFARIYPLHFILTTLLFLFSFSFANSIIGQLGILGIDLTLIQSFYPGTTFTGNAVSWSLSNEMFFYVLFPLLIVWYFRHKASLIFTLTTAAVFLIIGGFLLNETSFIEWLLYANPLCRIFDFIWGILLYNIVEKIPAKNKLNKIRASYLEFAAVCVVIAFYCLSYFVPFNLRHAVWYWLPIGLLICVFYLHKGIFSKLLSLKPFVYGGEISFSFYMIHLIVLDTLPTIFDTLNVHSTRIHLFVSAFIITVILSIISFKYIEQPLNKKIKKID